MDLATYLLGSSTGGGGFRPYAAGNKVYGGGRSMPTIGPVDPLGYKERDALTAAKRNALLNRLKAQQSGNFMSPQWLRGQS